MNDTLGTSLHDHIPEVVSPQTTEAEVQDIVTAPSDDHRTTVTIEDEPTNGRKGDIDSVKSSSEVAAGDSLVSDPDMPLYAVVNKHPRGKHVTF